MAAERAAIAAAARAPLLEPQSTNISKRDCVFVVNPRGANGGTGREWKRLYPSISLKLSKHYNVSQVLTTGPFHATEITRKAVEDGAAAVIAVGGDGTLHEVVNGFFVKGALAGPETALGVIPLGTGSDFARTFGWKNDPCEAVERLARGKRRRISVGRVAVGDSPSESYFISVGAVHLSAKAGYLAGKYKWLGNFAYVIAALQGFMSHKNCDLDIRMNGGQWKRFSNVTTIAIGNSKYYGGGMKIAPTADPFSGELEVAILQNFKWYHFLLHFFKLYKGTHVKLENVWHDKVRSIEIRQSDGNGEPVHVLADGEHLGFLPAAFEIIPAAIDFFC